MQVSVIMPCHNAARWIETALQSVAQQTLRPLEIIVINDASTDDSLDAIERSGIPVRLIEANVRNAGAARNIGIEAARGDWIAFLDADDIWYPHHLARAMELLESSQDVAFLANFDVLDLHGATTPLPRPLSLGSTQNGLEARKFLPVLVNFDPFGHSNVMYKRERALQVGSFDVMQERVHDMDLFLRVIRNETFCFDAQPHSAYRMDTPGSVSKNRVSRQYFCLRMLLKNCSTLQGQEMDGLIELNARQTMSLALFEGNREDQRRAKSLAWPHLSFPFRIACGLSTLCLPLAQTALRWSRALRNRKTLFS